jgi:hypothetical protein
MKQILLFLKTALFSLSLLITGTLSAQTNFVVKPATFVSADKPAAPPYSMSGILDGEGATGLSSSSAGPSDNFFYWDQSNNPVTFFININAASSISTMLFYGCWGEKEFVKNVTVRLYNGTTLLGTENLVIPYEYPSKYMVAFSQRYLNVNKVQLVIVNDHNVSQYNRTSLNEVVFGDFDCVTNPSTITTGTNRVLVLNTAIAGSIELARTTKSVGATITGLPAGVTGKWASQRITISGTPTQTGVFNYTLSTGIGCAATTGTITVTANACTTTPALVN